MAVSIKNLVKKIEGNARETGLISSESSPMVAVYQISRWWRELFERATRHRSEGFPCWSEKEVAAARIIHATLLYLQMEGCDNPEQLLKDVAEGKQSVQDTETG